MVATKPETIRITDESTRAEIAEALEARTRRLMAERARLSLSWQTRADRRRLLALVNDALDEFNSIK